MKQLTEKADGNRRKESFTEQTSFYFLVFHYIMCSLLAAFFVLCNLARSFQEHYCHLLNLINSPFSGFRWQLSVKQHPSS